MKLLVNPRSGSRPEPGFSGLVLGSGDALRRVDEQRRQFSARPEMAVEIELARILRFATVKYISGEFNGFTSNWQHDFDVIV